MRGTRVTDLAVRNKSLFPREQPGWQTVSKLSVKGLLKRLKVKKFGIF